MHCIACAYSKVAKGQLISKAWDDFLWKIRYSKKQQEQRLALLRNNSSSQKKQIRSFIFLENLRLDILLSKLTDL